MAVMKQGDRGAAVADLQRALANHGFPSGSASGNFDSATHDALVAFQNSAGLTPDGIAGPNTFRVLGLALGPPPPASRIPAVTVDIAKQIVPALRANIQANLGFVLNALIAPGLADKQMILMALGTIRAETGSFLPISEGESHFNTPPGGPPFSLYDSRTDLGNQGPPDGERFRGRGFIQLTGRANYAFYGNAIGLGDRLIDNPELANDPGTAAQLMASFLKTNEQNIRDALAAHDLAKARRLVNGGSHGEDVFAEAYNTGLPLIDDPVVVLQADATSAG